jgi:hypothetical protein
MDRMDSRMRHMGSSGHAKRAHGHHGCEIRDGNCRNFRSQGIFRTIDLDVAGKLHRTIDEGLAGVLWRTTGTDGHGTHADLGRCDGTVGNSRRRSANERLIPPRIEAFGANQTLNLL